MSFLPPCEPSATPTLVFVGELSDKTAIAGLVLGTRLPWRWVFTGMAAAFVVHVVIAMARDMPPDPRRTWRRSVSGSCFVAEWGDLTQILTTEEISAHGDLGGLFLVRVRVGVAKGYA